MRLHGQLRELDEPRHFSSNFGPTTAVNRYSTLSHMYNVTTLNLCYHLWLVEIELLSSETDSLVVTVAMTNC